MAKVRAALLASDRRLLKRIAENEEITHDLRRQTERLRTILETAADGIITVGARGRIETANRAAERMFGYEANALVGRPVSQVLPKPQRDRQAEPQLGDWSERIARRKDGTIFPIELVTSEFRDGEKRYTKIVRDITERKRLQWEVVQRVTDEQQSIGRTLHDGVAQHTTAAEMMLNLLHERLTASGSADAELSGDALRVLHDAQDQLRAVIRGVSSYTVSALGLEAALRHLCATTSRLNGIECSFTRRGNTELRDSNNATQLYYIASEAVHNALRHARPTRVVMALKRKRSAIELSVRNDGGGMPPKRKKGGAGLQIMSYRASLLNANLSIRRAEDGGTIVTCVVPIPTR